MISDNVRAGTAPTLPGVGGWHGRRPQREWLQITPLEDSGLATRRQCTPPVVRSVQQLGEELPPLGETSSKVVTLHRTEGRHTSRYRLRRHESAGADNQNPGTAIPLRGFVEDGS